MADGYSMGARAKAVSEIAASHMYFHKKTIKDINVKGKHVLVRVDFNVPVSDGVVTDDSRIRAALPTINYLRQKHAKIILCSHLGRPKGKPDSVFSLEPVSGCLAKLLDVNVKFMDKTINGEVEDAAKWLKGGEIMLLENLRFNPGEAENNSDFAKKLAELADIYVDDAFGAVHRRHASTVGITEYLPAVAGLLLEKEVSVLKKLIEAPKRPFMACLGGNKVSDKIGVIDRLLDLVDGIVAGGGMCFTFLKAKGCDIGDSIFEEDQVDLAAAILQKARDKEVAFYLPIDIIAADEMSEAASYKVVSAESIPDGWLGLDIGPTSIEIYSQALESAKTIFWNGPMGVFEIPQFAPGTKGVAQSIADASRHGSLTIVGGGDSLAALKMFDLEDQVSFASTGGGASLKILEGTPLPGVESLEDR